MPIDWDSWTYKPGATPVKRQLADWLEGLIRDGTAKPGERLPSERAWGPWVGHSYGTAREATTLLKEKGLLESGQGTGTFVADPARWQPPAGT